MEQLQLDLKRSDCGPVHDGCDPDRCFVAKMRYWRTGHNPFTPFREGWRGSSVFELERQEVAAAKANGRQIERAPL